MYIEVLLLVLQIARVMLGLVVVSHAQVLEVDLHMVRYSYRITFDEVIRLISSN